MTEETRPRGLEYTIASPWDDGFLSYLDSLNDAKPHNRFAEIFGSHRTSVTGGGRPAYRLPGVTKERFEQHVQIAHGFNMRFNYVMNAPSFSGREHDPEWQREVLVFLEYLAGCGVDTVTVAHPFLLNLVKNEFPDFRITLSLIAGVDSVKEAIRYEDMGVDVINLNPFTINRDFRALGAIRQSVKCKLEVYANIACLDRCPMREAHYVHSGRSSREGDNDDITQDSFLQQCSYAFLTEPPQLLRSPFIRPEDVYAYRDLGIDMIKLADRTEPTAVLSRTAQAYSEEKYEGNLFDLILRSGKKFRAGIASSHPEFKDEPVPIVIDNQALDRLNFIERIKDFRGEELQEFYRLATATAVRFTDFLAIDKWKCVLAPPGPEKFPHQPMDLQ